MAHHRLASTPETVRFGMFDAAFDPVLTVNSGDSVTVSEGRLVRWLRKPGERVSEKETVVEVETDKAVVEIEAPASGVLGAQLRAAGDVVKMGETIGSVKRA